MVNGSSCGKCRMGNGCRSMITIQYTNVAGSFPTIPQVINQGDIQAQEEAAVTQKAGKRKNRLAA